MHLFSQNRTYLRVSRSVSVKERWKFCSFIVPGLRILEIANAPHLNAVTDIACNEDPAKLCRRSQLNISRRFETVINCPVQETVTISGEYCIRSCIAVHERIARAAQYLLPGFFEHRKHYRPRNSSSLKLPGIML